jgi:hypothetical protein
MRYFLFRVGSVGKAPLYVNDEFGRKWPQEADHPFDFVPNGKYRRIGEGDSFRSAVCLDE